MTSLENRPNTALVVIDMQRGVVAEAIAYTNLSWTFSAAPHRTGDTAATDDIDFTQPTA